MFVDGVRQEPVPALSAIGPGRFLLDNAAHKLYLGGDPSGKTVELATARFAFGGPAEDVHIAGLIIEKYANAAQRGAIGNDGRPARWRIEHCEVRHNHGAGFEIGPDSTVSNNFIHHQGQLGIGGGESNITIEDNEIADNNQAGYALSWEAGGIKLADAVHAVIRGNFVHDNRGTGIWDDIDDVDMVVEGNRVENNDGIGIEHEISYAALIRANRVRGNGRKARGWVWDAQILVQNSRDVVVRDNRVEVPDGGAGIILVEQRREDGPFGPHLVRNCAVTGNIVQMAGASGIAAGLATDFAGSRADRDDNRFDADTYLVADVSGRFWAWPSWHGNLGLADFRRQYGQETAGAVIAIRVP